MFIEGDEAHHLLAVLRAKEGDVFFVTDGVGHLFRCRVEKVHPGGVVASVLAEVDPVPQPSVDICLAVGVLKSRGLETALDWATQLGIGGFAPLLADFSVKEMSAESNDFRRLHKVALRAMKQSKRAWLPQIYEPMPLHRLLQVHAKNFDWIIFADPDGVPAPPKRTLQPGTKLLVVVGPEGGLSSSERGELGEYGAVPIALGPARLRAETAAVVAVAKILAWSGNL